MEDNTTPAIPLNPPILYDQSVPPRVKQIYPAMVAIMADLAKIGIAKDRKNEQQGFRFRGIDDVFNVASQIIAKHNVLFLPNYQHGRPDVERITAKGGTLITSDVQGNFMFVSAVDGSFVTVSAPGNAMDSGDKGTNKAMSAALKYALLHTFLIPTESNEDADSVTYEPSVPKPPTGFEEWFTDMMAVADNGRDPVREAWKASKEEFRLYAQSFRQAELETAREKAAKVTKAAEAAAAASAQGAEMEKAQQRTAAARAARASKRIVEREPDDREAAE